jgi:hypothetical protein
MGTIRKETDQSINRKKMEDLYRKYITLAKDVSKKEDRILAESYYQLAEYYLYALNELGGFISTVDSLVKKETNLPKKEGVLLPFRGNFLRRSRRATQDKEAQNKEDQDPTS